jgi:hypothetical protein
MLLPHSGRWTRAAEIFRLPKMDLAQRALTAQPRAERSAALGTRTPNPVALKGQNERDILPFQGDEPCFSGNPGRRFALPWALTLLPHSGRWTRAAEIFRLPKML